MLGAGRNKTTRVVIDTLQLPVKPSLERSPLGLRRRLVVCGFRGFLYFHRGIRWCVRNLSRLIARSRRLRSSGTPPTKFCRPGVRHAHRYVLWLGRRSIQLARSGSRVWIKSRSRHKPLSLLIESVDQAEELAQPLPQEFYALARRYWPGPLTIIVKASSSLPLKVTANTGNVALRIPNAQIPLAVVLRRKFPSPQPLQTSAEKPNHHGARCAGSVAGPHFHYCGRGNLAARSRLYYH